MFGHDWEKAEGKILATHITASGPVAYADRFVVDVQCADGHSFKTEIEAPNFAPDFKGPEVGDVVSVEVDRKNDKARFDRSDPRLSHKASLKTEDDDYRRALDS